MKRLAAAVTAVLALSACSVNIPDPRDKVDQMSEDLKSEAKGTAQDALFDRGYDMPSFDRRYDREKTRTMARSMCVEIEELGSVEAVMLKFIRMDTTDELDPEYMGKLIALSVVSYCPDFARQVQ